MKQPDIESGLLPEEMGEKTSPADKGEYEKNEDPELLLKDYLEENLPGFGEQGAPLEDIIDGYEGDLSENDIIDLLDDLSGEEKSFLIKKGEGEAVTYTLNDAYYIKEAA